MDFLKQKGPLAREFCNTLIYIISLVSLKPSSLQRVLTELQWNGMWFFSLAFFAVIFMEMLSDLLVDYFNLRNEQRSDWSGKAKLKCTVRDFEKVKQAVDYLKAHSLNTAEDLNHAIDSLNQTAAPLRRQLKQNENRMRAIAQIKDAAAVHAKLKPIHDTFIKKNFKLTKGSTSH